MSTGYRQSPPSCAYCTRDLTEPGLSYGFDVTGRLGCVPCLRDKRLRVYAWYQNPEPPPPEVQQGK